MLLLVRALVEVRVSHPKTGGNLRHPDTTACIKRTVIIIIIYFGSLLLVVVEIDGQTN